nr:hypothetical protein [Tanacetum cinerariifolium]
MTPSTIAIITITSQAPILSATAPSTIIKVLPNFGSLFGSDNRLRTLEANFFEFMQTNQFAGAVSAIPGIVQRYMDQRMNEAVKTVNEQLEAEVLTRSSHSSKTSYVVAADLSEMELKKILIKRMEGNKSIQRFDEQRNLYKAVVEAYESDKIILDTYGETVTLKKRCDDDANKDEEPSTGLDQGSKRHKEGKEPESVSAPTKTATRSADRSTQRSKSRQESARDVYSKKRIIDVTELKIVDWHNYKHLDWIKVRRDDDKLYKFKEGDFKRLSIQDIEDMLLLLVQGRLTNLTVEERFAFNISLRMFTRSINKDKKNRLMRIDELHKFNDGTLIDVRTTQDDRLKGIQMREDHEELGEVCWRKAVRGRLQDATKDHMINRMLLLSFKRMKMEILLEPTSNKLMVASDTLIDFQIKFSISIGETVTHWFTLIVLSTLRRSDKENMLSLMNLILRSILTDLQVTPTKPRRMTKPYSSHRFIANCFNARNFKMEVKILTLLSLVNVCACLVPYREILGDMIA